VTTGFTVVNRNVKTQLPSHLFRIFIQHSLFLSWQILSRIDAKIEGHKISFRLVGPWVLCETDQVLPVIHLSVVAGATENYLLND